MSQDDMGRFHSQMKEAWYSVSSNIIIVQS